MSRIWKEARALAAFLRSRAFALGMLSVVLAFVIFQISTMTNVVYVTDEEGSELHYTMESDPGKIFETYAGQLDQKQTGYRGLSGHYAELNTTRTCKASIQADGGISFHDVPVGTTVGDLLYQQGITYDGNDLLTPDADKPILDGDQITLQRVEYERYTEDEEIPYQTVRKNTSLIRLGRTQTIQQGAEGSKTLTYMRRTVDGRREEVQLLGENVTKPPVTEPEEPELKPIYEYCDCTCDACRDCQGTIVGYEPVEKPSGPSDKPGVPVETTKEIEITTKVTQYGTGYYVADNGFGTGKLNNGKAITEDNVLELLDEAQRIWPDGITWTVPNTYNNNWYQSSGILVDNLLHSNGYNTNSNFACGGFAAMLSDYIFGQKGNPFHRVYDPMDIRAGDIIVIKNADGTVKHISFAQTSTIQSGTYAGRLWTADGNTSGKVSWSTATKQQYGVPVSEAFQAQFNPGRTWEVWSRYPA